MSNSRTVAGMETQQEVENHPLRARVQASLRRLPPPIRKMLVIVTSGLLIIIGISLVWLPGPFTLPFVIGGFAALGKHADQCQGAVCSARPVGAAGVRTSGRCGCGHRLHRLVSRLVDLPGIGSTPS